MQWTDLAIFLYAKKHGENHAIASILTKEYGLYNGIIKGINNKKITPLYQPGNLITAAWKARLIEHLGILQIELVKSIPYDLLTDKIKLFALSGICNILSQVLPERVPEQKLFTELCNFLTLTQIDNVDWLKKYVTFELLLLCELGFGLDLSGCAVTGQSHDLCYVSPKSGRAVSKIVGTAYHNKLFILPKFFLDSSHSATRCELEQGLIITGYFIEKHLLIIKRTNLPSVRLQLLKAISDVLG